MTPSSETSMPGESGWLVESASDADWPDAVAVAAAGFGWSVGQRIELDAWRTMVPGDGAEIGAVVVRDGGEVVGHAMYLDLELTVPGGAVLPAAGVSLVAVAPTHRRRGVLRAMYDELHQRIAAAGYPLAALTASQGGIYGRFGYGPASVVTELSIDRRFAEFHPDAPGPGGVRVVTAAEHRDDFADVYDRWRLRTPGGLARPAAILDDLLADREADRDGGTEWFALLHDDGYVLYRVHGHSPKTVRVGEFRAVTPRAHAALWRTLLGLDLMGDVVVATHPDDALPYLLTDTRLPVTVSRNDELWLRPMDIPAVLSARRYAADLSVVFSVRDGFRDDGGRFALVISGGVATCVATDTPADMELDLDVLGSLYLGAHRASTLWRAGRLRCADPDLVALLDAALAVDPPAQLGFFF